MGLGLERLKQFCTFFVNLLDEYCFKREVLVRRVDDPTHTSFSFFNRCCIPELFRVVRLSLVDYKIEPLRSGAGRDRMALGWGPLEYLAHVRWRRIYLLP